MNAGPIQTGVEDVTAQGREGDLQREARVVRIREGVRDEQSPLGPGFHPWPAGRIAPTKAVAERFRGELELTQFGQRSGDLGGTAGQRRKIALLQRGAQTR